MVVTICNIVTQLNIRNKDGTIITPSSTTNPTESRIQTAIDYAVGEIERATGRKYTEARYTEIKQHPYISKMFGTEYAVELKPNHIPLHTKGDGDYVQFKTKTNPNDPWVNMPDSDVLWLPETNSIHVKVTKYNFYDIFKVSYCTDTIYTKDAEKCIVLSACVDIMRTSFDADWYSSYSTVQQAADRMEKQYHELMRRLTVMQPV